MLSLSKLFRFVLACSIAGALLIAQQAVEPVNLATGGPTAKSVPNSQPTSQGDARPAANMAPDRAPNYVLGPEDQILIHALHAEEISDKPVQIGGDGYINLALVGRVKAEGLTVNGLEQELAARLKNYVVDPQVTVLVGEYRSQPVSVVGAVNTPGVVQLRGQKNLVQLIALAGGLKAEAGNSVTITRELSKGRIPLPGAADDPTGRYSVAHVNLHDVMEAHNPQDNLIIQVNDVVMIPRAQLLYVVGEVNRPGGYVLNEKDSVSLLQAVALAGGLTRTAAPKKAKILHQDPNNANRTELATNVNKILNGQAPDVQLRPDDILFIPNNLPKSAGARALDVAVNMAGAAIWHF